MFIVKKGGNDRFRLALFKLLLPVNQKGECNREKVEGREREREGEKRGEEVGEMSRRLKTDYIQTQQTVPLFTEEG